jgi:hypothetical protein
VQTVEPEWMVLAEALEMWRRAIVRRYPLSGKDYGDLANRHARVVLGCP